MDLASSLLKILSLVCNYSKTNNFDFVFYLTFCYYTDELFVIWEMEFKATFIKILNIETFLLFEQKNL